MPNVFALNYHLIMVTKHRRNMIDNAISQRLREIFEHIQPAYNITLQDWTNNFDHVHAIFSAYPSSKLAKFINAYRRASSRIIAKEYPVIREKLWKGHFWSHGFCLISTDGASAELIQNYIDSQSG